MQLLLATVLGVVLVTDYGAIPGDGVNDRLEITDALAAAVAAEDTAHLPCYSPYPSCQYDLVGEDGSGRMVAAGGGAYPLVITADPGVTLVASCGGELGVHEVLLQIGALHGVSISGLTLDASECAARVVEILYIGTADGAVTVEDSRATGGTQHEGFNNAAGWHIRGGFPLVDLDNVTADNIRTTQVCDSGKGARGIEILPYCGETDYQPIDVQITGAYVRQISDPEGGCNSDGVMVQTLCDDFPVGASWSVTGSRFEDCEYRAIKSQALAGTVTGSTFVRRSFAGHHEIDCQYSDCTVSGNVFRSEGFRASSVTASAIRDAQTSNALTFADNLVSYSGVTATYPVQAYDLTTAGSVLNDIVVRRNTIEGAVLAVLYVSAPFAGAHAARVEYTKALELTDPVVLAAEEAVTVADLCNVTGAP